MHSQALNIASTRPASDLRWRRSPTKKVPPHLPIKSRLHLHLHRHRHLHLELSLVDEMPVAEVEAIPPVTITRGG